MIRKFFIRHLYPLLPGDWYKIKRYKGLKSKARFANFIAAQRERTANFYKEFRSLRITRQQIMSGDKRLDSVLAVPSEKVAQGKPGHSFYFIMFFGRLESYEKRFRDIAMQASKTGASVLGFNPKGVFCSEGVTNSFSDFVDDGIAVVDFLLKNGVEYDNIILQGNSLGGAVQERVSEYYRSIKGRPMRQINSNSFRSLGAVAASRWRVPFGERLFGGFLECLGWGFKPGPDFYKTGPYRCHLRRLNDRTINRDAEYHAMVNFEEDNKNCPENYKKTHKWLYDHSQLTYRGASRKDPHILSLYMFEAWDEENAKYISVYDVINRYLEGVKNFRAEDKKN